MMVEVARIAMVSYLDTIPFLYGVQHADNLRADPVPSFSEAIFRFEAREADMALVPADAVPALANARPVTGYCLGVRERATVDFLLLNEPASPAAPLFTGSEAPLSALLDAKKPWAYALWVARADADPDQVEELQHALTYGLEHAWEAVVACGYDRKPYDAYGHLARLDCIFDNQKRKALQKFWDSGLKVSPRTNPG